MAGRDAEPDSRPRGEESAGAKGDAADAVQPAPPASLAAVDPGEPAEPARDELSVTAPGVPTPRPEMRTAPALQPGPPAVAEPASPAEQEPPVSHEATMTSPAMRSGSTAQPVTPSATPPWLRAEEKPPSWPSVVRTTIQLWFERRRRRAGQEGRPKRSRWRLAAVIGLAVVVFAAGALTMELIGRNSLAGSGHPAHPATGGAAAAAAKSRSEAAAWVTTEVSHGAIVACDPVMCNVLKQHGFPVGSMLTLASAANDPLGSAVVIADAAVRNYFGPRLTGEYAPVAIAAFGSGTARIQVLVIAADGALAYDKALQADQRARRLTGQELLGNPRITTSPAARADIASGQVDSRLLMSLAALAHQVHQVRIASFSPTAPGAAPGVPLRSMDLAVPDGTDASAYLAAARSFLRAQRAPYLASTIEVTRLADGSQVLRVGFSAPSPLGILGNQDSAKQPS